MYYTLSADLLSGYNAFDRRMVLENHSVIAARLNGTNSHHQQQSASGNSNSNNNNNSSSTSAATTQNERIMGHQGPVVDLLVTMIAVPVLILCALQLEKNLHDMTNSPESRWLVFALGVGMLIVSVIICGYVTHRMGVCIWAGPIDEAGNRIGSRSSSSGGVSHINSQNDILRIVDALPPSYESVVKFDIPPPPYDCVVIDMKDDDDNDDNNISGNNNNNNNTTTTTNATNNANNNNQNNEVEVATVAGVIDATRTQTAAQQQYKEPQLPDALATMHI